MKYKICLRCKRKFKDSEEIDIDFKDVVDNGGYICKECCIKTRNEVMEWILA